MGAYLSSPVFEPESASGQGRGLSFGVSSVQGWRMTQEDAHNCLIDFDENCSFFAVYDGHGGSEVANYCALKLPDFIRSLESYKAGDFKQALIDGFVKFDETLTQTEVIEALKQLAQYESDSADDDEDVENERELLKREATMPLEELLRNYTNRGEKASKKLDASSKSNEIGDESSSKLEACGDSKKSVKSKKSGTAVDDKALNGIADSNGESQAHAEDKSSLPPGNDKESAKNEGSSLSEPEKTTLKSRSSADATASATDSAKDVSETAGGSSSSTNSNSTDTSGGSPRAAQERAKQVIKDAVDDSDDDEDDENESSDDSDAYQNEDPSGDEDDSEDDDDDDDDDEENETYGDDDADEEDEDEGINMPESDIPGCGSGSTAVVALLYRKSAESSSSGQGDGQSILLTVANAGDSRAVLCRAGKAVDLSVDHKPEDSPERSRIERAGGHISYDGRVNGGLNLSRAIGDHIYKRNKSLPLTDQMISPLPDIRSMQLRPVNNGGTDEFLVLACDGIWNCMTSQEVVDFVTSCLKQDIPLVDICERLFRRCIAPDTRGDGTGCDNMTCIIVNLQDKGANVACANTASAKETQKSGTPVEDITRSTQKRNTANEGGCAKRPRAAEESS